MSDLIVLEKPTPSQADVAAPVAPVNYASTFSPDSPQYSVNTGNANVRQIEDLRAMVSEHPQILPAPPDNMKYGYGILIAIGFYLILKGH